MSEEDKGHPNENWAGRSRGQQVCFVLFVFLHFSLAIITVFQRAVGSSSSEEASLSQMLLQKKNVSWQKCLRGIHANAPPPPHPPGAAVSLQDREGGFPVLQDESSPEEAWTLLLTVSQAPMVQALPTCSSAGPTEIQRNEWNGPHGDGGRKEPSLYKRETRAPGAAAAASSNKNTY